MDLEPLDERSLPGLAALARAHVRLVPPGLVLSDREVAHGLEWHAHWPFYSPGLDMRQVQVATQGEDVLAALQLAWTDAGWGYGALAGDGPLWLRRPHPVVAWVFAWPGEPAAAEAAEALLEQARALVSTDGLPGLEAFRGGPGFAPFGCQLSSHWPHLWQPLAAAGFGEPRELQVYGGECAPDSLPRVPDVPAGVAFRHRTAGRRRSTALEGQREPVSGGDTPRRPLQRSGRGGRGRLRGRRDESSLAQPSPGQGLEAGGSAWGRLEAWLDGDMVGVCEALPLGAAWMDDEPDGGDDELPADPSSPLRDVTAFPRRQWPWRWEDSRAASWAVIRRLSVQADYRGRGIGTALLHRQLSRLGDHGCARYLLHTFPAEEETPARALFAKMGAALIDRQYVLRCPL